MDKKEEILEATFFYFSKKGYATAMSDIAKKVELKPPSLYSHFESKEEIIYLTIKREIENYFKDLSRVLEVVNGASTEEKLKTVFFSIFKYFKEKDRLRFWRNISLIENAELRKKCSELIRGKEITHSTKMADIFAEGILLGDLKIDLKEGSIYLYLAMIQGILDGMLL